MRLYPALILAACIMLTFSVAASAQEPSADEIIKKADDLARGASSYAEMTMKVATKRWKRTTKMQAWTQGTEKSFIVVLQPAKDKGTTFLKLGREMWNYLPKVERKVKIPPSMMLQSWMGSDFTNDDISRADSMITDYTHKIVGEETIDGKPCWKIECIPHENAPVFWGKVVIIVQKDGTIYRRMEYYDEDMQLAKAMSLDQIKETSGRRVPTRYTMTNNKKPDNKTVLIFDKLEFDIKIPDSTFTMQNLSRGGR